MVAETWRCFVAIPLPDAVVRAVRELIDDLATTGADVRWVHPEQVHLTLRFVGDVPLPDVERLRAALRAVPFAAPLHLTMQGLGRFPRRGPPRVFWAGIGGDTAALGELAAAIDRAAGGVGLAREERPFAAHLTLGRARSVRGTRDLEERIAARQAGVAFDFPPVRSFRLYRSELLPQGARHTCLEEYPAATG